VAENHAVLVARRRPVWVTSTVLRIDDRGWRGNGMTANRATGARPHDCLTITQTSVHTACVIVRRIPGARVLRVLGIQALFPMRATRVHLSSQAEVLVGSLRPTGRSPVEDDVEIIEVGKPHTYMYD